MRWPWQKKMETRQESGYTDTLTRLRIDAATGDAKPSATAALEACCSLVSRCFASAQVKAPEMYREAVTPSILALIGRALIRSGECVLLLSVGPGGLRLLPANSYDITGGHSPETWVYRLDLIGPNEASTLHPVLGADVIHVRYQVNPAAPWQGIAPLQSASLSGKLSASTLEMLGDDSAGPRGSFLPTPKDGQDPTIETLKSDIRQARGNVVLTESQNSGNFDNQSFRNTPREWETRRFGGDASPGNVSLAELATIEVSSACGIPPVLFSAKIGDTGQREAYRRLLHSTISPLGNIVQEELSNKAGNRRDVEL